MKTPAYISCLVAGVVLAFTALTRAGEDIAVTELPPVVKEAIAQKYPGSVLLSAERETKDGKVYYEVKIRDEQIKRELDIAPDGTILKMEVDD